MSKSSRNSCLLIVDVQNGFINEYTEHLPALIEAEQHNYRHNIATKFVNADNSPYRKTLNWHSFDENSKDVSFAYTMRLGVLIVPKTTYSAVTVDLVRTLHDLEISTIDICGIDTDICVLQTAVALFEAGFQPRVLSHLCASHGGTEYHTAALRVLERSIGKTNVLYPR